MRFKGFKGLRGTGLSCTYTYTSIKLSGIYTQARLNGYAHTHV